MLGFRLGFGYPGTSLGQVPDPSLVKYGIHYDIPLSNAFARAKPEPPDWCGGPYAKSYSTLFVNSRIAFLRSKNNVTCLEIFGNLEIKL